MLKTLTATRLKRQLKTKLDKVNEVEGLLPPVQLFESIVSNIVLYVLYSVAFAV